MWCFDVWFLNLKHALTRVRGHWVREVESSRNISRRWLPHAMDLRTRNASGTLFIINVAHRNKTKPMDRAASVRSVQRWQKNDSPWPPWCKSQCDMRSTRHSAKEWKQINIVARTKPIGPRHQHEQPGKENHTNHVAALRRQSARAQEHSWLDTRMLLFLRPFLCDGVQT